MVTVEIRPLHSLRKMQALSLPEKLNLAKNDKDAHYREQRRNRCHYENNWVLKGMTQERHAVRSTNHKSHPDYGHNGIECRVELFPNQSHCLVDSKYTMDKC